MFWSCHLCINSNLLSNLCPMIFSYVNLSSKHCSLTFLFSPFCMDNIYRGLYCIFPCFTAYSSVSLLHAFISYPLPIQFMGFGHVSWFLCMSCCLILQFLFMIFICQLSSNDLPIKVFCCREQWNWSNYHHYYLVASTNHLELPVCHSSYS